ncbi:MAG TPA: 3-phosphoshikimate 1-carboxyvinyltransferase [Solirubrobacterales bacterium]|nr:3-phosphoshikimate 1-carboxyvinyltransferase [Solirubrobacterales bacterium]
MSAVRFEPSGPLRGELTPPPDKSISHRAAIVAAMGEGECRVESYLDSHDTRSTLVAVGGLGADIEEAVAGPGRLDLKIRGVGLRGARFDGASGIDVGNAGTLLRVLPGWLAGQGRGAWTLDGDESIRRRPVDRVAQPLREMGARLECRDERLPPLRVEGAALSGISYELPIASAQVKSCVLLAGLLADGETRVTEPAPTRDHTERMLRAAGASLEVESVSSLVTARSPQRRRITVRGTRSIELGSIAIPGDLSSAAFLIAAALLVHGSDLRIDEVGLNPTRSGFLGIANRMGGLLEVDDESAAGNEPRGTVRARHGGLTATRVGPAEVPLAIDELPLVALLGCFADGDTVVTGAQELRHKESDRIAAVVDGLRGIGAEIEALPDGFAVTGTGGLRGGALDTRGDHRMAMLGAVAGLASREGVEVRGFDSVSVSYPRFESELAQLASG